MSLSKNMKILWIGLERNLGIEKDHQVLILNKDNWDYNSVVEFKPDILIEREFNDKKYIYTDEVKFVKNKFPECKTIFWAIDTHLLLSWHKEYSLLFDYTFLAVSKYVKEFKRALWLPLCFPASDMPNYNIEKKYPIGFIGRYNITYLEERTAFLKKIKSEYKSLCHFETDYKSVYQKMSQCFIMLNKSIRDDLNYRVFEALACKNTLVTNSVPDLYKIKGLAERVCIYKTNEGAVDCIRNIIKDNIIYSDTEYISKGHLLYHRINKLLSMVKTGKQEEF